MLVAVPVVVGAVLWGKLPLLLVLVVIYVLAARETQALIRELGGRDFWLLSAIGGAFILLGTFGPAASFLATTMVLLIASAAVILVTGEAVGAALGFLLTLWIAWPLGLVMALETSGPFGPHEVLATFAVIWASEVAAYLAGSAIGRNRLVPLVSPAKTWEGALGGLAAAALVGWAVHDWLALPGAGGAILGAVIAIFAQAGDLFESSLKRKAKVKDSGSFLPGHGGVLDRIDAILFGVLAVYYYLYLRGAP